MWSHRHFKPGFNIVSELICERLYTCKCPIFSKKFQFSKVSNVKIDEREKPGV